MIDPRDIARTVAKETINNRLQQSVQSALISRILPDANTYQGQRSQDGLLRRSPLSGDQINDGVGVFNRVSRGDRVVEIPGIGSSRARLLGRYVSRPIQVDDKTVRRPRRIFNKPQPVNWMGLSATLDGRLLGLQIEQIEGYDAYVNPPFASPLNFTGFTTNLDFDEPTGQVQIDVNGGISNSIKGAITINPGDFSVYTTKTVAFGYQIFQVNSSDLSITITLEQSDNLGSTLASDSVIINRSTGARQPNGLYLISFDQSIFPVSKLNILDAAVGLAVSMDIVEA